MHTDLFYYITSNDYHWQLSIDVVFLNSKSVNFSKLLTYK